MLRLLQRRCATRRIIGKLHTSHCMLILLTLLGLLIIKRYLADLASDRMPSSSLGAVGSFWNWRTITSQQQKKDSNPIAEPAALDLAFGNKSQKATEVSSQDELSSPANQPIHRANESSARNQESPLEYSTERFMIYFCNSDCGGWADRLKGIVTAYLIAIVTKRRFGIQIVDIPCPLTDYLLSNEVNWVISSEIDLKSGSKMYCKMDSVGFYNSLSTANLDEIFPERVAFFYSNLDRFEKIKYNKLYKKQLEWMQPLTRAQIFVQIYHLLFKFSPRLQAAINVVLKQAKPSGDELLVCGHLRMAGNAEKFPDSEKRHTRAHGETMLKFLRNFDSASSTYNVSMLGKSSLKSAVYSNSSKVRFFVTSDSKIFMDKAELLFGDRFIKTPGKVIHLDRKYTNRIAACGGFAKILVDQYLLSTCDVLVISRSALSRQSAYLRGTDDHLYCIYMNGKLEKCSTANLKEMYDNNV